jgi:hypothetical protein
MNFPGLFLLFFYQEGNILDSALQAFGRVERREGIELVHGLCGIVTKVEGKMNMLLKN